MIFRAELVRQIRTGRKTMTRRPAKVEPGCRYQPGKSYAVQPGRGQSATCRIHVTSVRKELVGEIAFADARAEGFATTEDFKAYWIAIHERTWLEHENAMLNEAENDDGVVLDRDVWIMRRSLDLFDRKHAHRPVWVISFHLDVAPVGRLLALRSQEGYTSNPHRALPGEPEAVDADTQAWVTGNAHQTTAQWQALEAGRRERDRALLSREDQIVRLQRAARLRSIDASRELWALRNMLGSTDERFVTKLRKAEAKVFQRAA
jgi:uncharacterized protein YqfB (UPF0267 family)